MVVREVKVKDFKGQERDYKLYFNMTEAEIMDFEFGRERGGISEFYDRILRAQDIPAIIQALKDVIISSYGILSADGELFQKGEEISKRFTFTTAYSEFMMRLYTNDQYAQKFLKELFPEEVMKKILARIEEQKKASGTVTQFPENTATESAPVTTPGSFE